MDITDEIRVPRRTFLLLASLLVIALTSSLFVCIFVDDSSGVSLENVVYVKNEDALKNAINNAPTDKSIAIALDNDITLSDTLIIPINKNITLTSNKINDFYKLVGADGKSTITVEGSGVLRLDGVIVTHVNGAEGRGVYVMENGYFIMNNGEVSGNTNTYDMYVWPRDGGGVFNRGVFELYSGKIFNNQATSGGGIYNMDGTFKMFGGEISNNTATGYYTDAGIRYYTGNGGGVYVGGVFELCGGKISNNKADGDGGGVYMNMYFGSTQYGVFSMFGGTISSNTAGKDGGGVYSVQGGRLIDGIISSNTAGQNGGGVYWSNYWGDDGYDKWNVVVSGNTAKANGNDVYPNLGSSGGDGESSNGNNGSGGNGGGSGSGGNGGSSNGSGGFSLRDVVVICVGVALVIVGVVVAVLFFSFKKDTSFALSGISP
ncbi:MAG: hypothetical protein LBB87_00095 [Nitrososphaerota archaeon]|jgi:hypothetical protein|nr:hypothetical protein [Nitrososphaerota archaeon]